MKLNKNNDLIPRPPVVAVMGHIDHGKSKLLDFIRQTNIVEKEAGGITQHIGAYEAEVKCEDAAHAHKTRKITFLDTPGHEAFSQMRVRGAKAADVAILVVAADEGPKPQTIEAHEAIKNIGIPFVIALNKIDKPNAEPEKVKSQLAEHQIFVEGYGGNIPTVNISAKTGEGIDDLLDVVLLLAEMENLQANPTENASGFVIESKLGTKRGVSATLLIQNGTMKKGMFVVAGEAVSPVKIFENFQGLAVEKATFSSPIRIFGFDKMPEAGAEFKTFNSKKEAEAAIGAFKEKNLPEKSKFKKTEIVEGKIALPIIIKADFSGSLEALEKEILKLEKEETALDILRKGVGNINENDARLASSAENAIIIGFNVKTNPAAKEIAEKFRADIFTSDIIYKISEWLEEQISKRKKRETEEKIIGTAKILKLFSKIKNKQLVGGMVISGKIEAGKTIKIKRDDLAAGEGKILELRRNKIKVKEVGEENEFGAMIESKIELDKNCAIEIIEKIR